MAHPTQGFGDADRRPCSPSATARAIRSLSVAFTGAPRSHDLDHCRDLGRGNGAAGTPRVARRRTPSPIRTLTVGSGFSPDQPHGWWPWARGLPQAVPAVTAGRDLHPNPEGSFSVFGCYLT